MNLISVLLQVAPAPAGGGFGMLIMFGGLILMMWFFMIRPQQKQRKKEQAFRAGLQKGDRVITNAGIYGTIKEVSDFEVSLEIAHNVVVKVNINYIFPAESAAIDQK